MVPDAAVYQNMHLYGIRCLAHEDYHYGVPAEFFGAYCASHFLPELVSRNIEALLIVDPDRNVVAAIRDEDVPPARALIRLRQIGFTVEHGCHASPGISGWREMEDGSKAWVWTADSGLNVAHE
ncbi:hypothetical protein AWC08_00745 [Mycobacterium gordonae]|uniref:Uncharacterized protein n=2 Tax=Mycobacterium gordonae TaxID=1778 RepID=A0A1X1VYQ0_MYCGO|nr:hypothetical protein AWC08_00745 [Mycobacterium gordonae]